MRKNKISLALILLFGMLLLFGCTQQNKEQDNRLKVAVSIVPQKTFVEKIAGDLAEVTVMIPPGNSPANYQPTPKEMKDFSDAQLYFAIGVPAEEANIRPKISELNENMKVVNLAEKVAEVYPDRFFQAENEEEHEGNAKEETEKEHEHQGRDPHIWLSPKRVIVMVEEMRDALIQLDSENKSVYEENAQNYIQELETLDKEIQKTLQGVDSPSFIIYHPSFGYFAEDYGLNMVAIEENGKTATAQGIKEVVDFANEKEIKVIFYQEEFDSNQAETVAKEIGGETLKVAPLAPNYIENMMEISKVFQKVFQKN